jgi:MFS family permease
MGLVNHLIHVPWFQFDTGKDLKFLFLMQTVKVFVEKFALLFLPVLLFQFGLSLQTSNQFYFLNNPLSGIQLGIIVISLFYIVLRIATIASTPIVAVLMYKFGNRMVSTLGYAFFGLAVVALHQAVDKPLFFIFSAIAFGVFVAFNYISESFILVNNTHKANIGKDIGLSRFLMQMANMIAPLMGGLVIVYFGFQSLFLIGLVILIGLLIISQYLSPKKISKPVQYQDLLELFKNSAFQQMLISTVGRYIADVAIFIWPVYLFILLGSVDRVGYLYSASFFLAMIVSMIGGAQVDKAKSSKTYLGSGSSLAGLWILRIFVINPLSITFIDALDRLIANYHWIYFETTLLKIVKIKKPLTYLLARSLALSIFAVITWIIISLLFLLLINGWVGLFVLAAIGVLSSLVLKENMSYDRTK